MKTRILLLSSCAALALASCSNNIEYAAEGSFEATEILVSAEGNGKIMSLDVREGSTISADAVVGYIDTTQLNLQKQGLKLQQEAILSNSPDVQVQVASQREQISKLKTEKTRVENLLKDNAATEKQLDDITSQIAIAERQLNAVLSTMANNVESINTNAAVIENQIEQVQTRISQSLISSPIDATVLAKYAEQGEFISVGRPIMKVADMKNMHVRAYFTSQQLPDLKLGGNVIVVADFGGEALHEYKGTIEWISEKSEFTPKNIQTSDSRANLVYAVKIAVENDGRIKIGTHAKVKL